MSRSQRLLHLLQILRGQQNAAMVEEMSAAGATLAQECLDLEEMLSRFQLGQQVLVLRETARSMGAAAGLPSGNRALRRA